MRDYRTAGRVVNAATAPLVVAGKFDRAAIMRRAVKIARATNTPGQSWQRRMAVGLRTAWAWAKRDLSSSLLLAA